MPRKPPAATLTFQWKHEAREGKWGRAHLATAGDERTVWHQYSPPHLNHQALFRAYSMWNTSRGVLVPLQGLALNSVVRRASPMFTPAAGEWEGEKELAYYRAAGRRPTTPSARRYRGVHDEVMPRTDLGRATSSSAARPSDLARVDVQVWRGCAYRFWVVHATRRQLWRCGPCSASKQDARTCPTMTKSKDLLSTEEGIPPNCSGVQSKQGRSFDTSCR